MTRAEAEDFLYHEAALLDAWKLDEWLALLTDDATYRVPSNDAREGDPAGTLFLIADDYARIKGRVARLKDPMAHVESPHSRTRRMITNVRIVTPGTDHFLPKESAAQETGNKGSVPGVTIHVEANFTVHRFRRGEQVSQYVGRYRYRLRVVDGQPRIATREAILDPHELGSLGAVSFIL